jgi:hypothetical protein
MTKDARRNRNKTFSLCISVYISFIISFGWLGFFIVLDYTSLAIFLLHRHNNTRNKKRKKK